ncbi:drug resistance transporter, EmrB/QacA subfamily [Thermomonospora echinospora]|uniref:Drug resistance transporter, EmrB/QacA subfamily n=1 Tax=Thermomonospora echinospora TaxID=1992 RepID=A0A1H6CDN9_9ACTN|nr:drug resistance transporter, EmrB/QacA subfamily [Thermomonospora echinospora]
MVAVSAFMITMDNTVVAIAQESIRKDLGLNYSELRWVTVGYILMFSCLMIAGGRLTDIYGCRVTYVTGMTIFTGASAVCGLAGSDAVLILARVVQGAGSALALPATLVMVTVGRSDRQRALGQITWLASLALAMAGGPSIGGIIVEHWHWGWIFLINVPVGVVVIGLGLVVLVGRDNTEGVPVDLPGVLLSATTLFAFVYAFHVGTDLGFTDPAVLSVLALAAVAAACFVVVESWAPDPMIDLGFFRNRVFSGGIVTSMLWGIGFNGVMYFSSLFMQTVLGFRPTTAALAYVPSALLVLVMTPVSFMLAAKVGSRLTISVGMVLMAAGMAAFTALRPGHGFGELMPGIALVSVGSALTLPLAMYVLKSVPDERAGVAGGIINVVRELSAGIGIAVLGVVVDTLERHAAQSGAGRAEAFRQGASVGLLVGAGLVIIGAVVSALTLPTKREAGAADGAKKPEPTAEPATEQTAGAASRPEPIREPEPVGVGAPVYAAPVTPDTPNDPGRPSGPADPIHPEQPNDLNAPGSLGAPGGLDAPSGLSMTDGPSSAHETGGPFGPSDPVRPDQPVATGDLNGPQQSSGRFGPVGPTRAGRPIAANDQNRPARPGGPVGPADPVRPERPINGNDPSGPSGPIDATRPDLPVIAHGPDGSGRPGRPGEPEVPDATGTGATGTGGKGRARRLVRRTPRYGTSSARSQRSSDPHDPSDHRQPPRLPRQSGQSGWERASRASAELWPPPPPGWYKPYDPDDYYDDPGSEGDDTRPPPLRGDAW